MPCRSPVSYVTHQPSKYAKDVSYRAQPRNTCPTGSCRSYGMNQESIYVPPKDLGHYMEIYLICPIFVEAEYLQRRSGRLRSIFLHLAPCIAFRYVAWSRNVPHKQ